MTTYLIPSPNDGLRRWPASEATIRKLLGHDGHKWPDNGIPVTALDGQRFTRDGVTPVKILVWVGAKITGKPRAQHRAQCRCPGCGKVFSVGRLAQHRCKK